MRKLPDHLTAENTIVVGRPVAILLDGVEMDDVLEAQTAEGWIIQAQRDEHGQLQLTGDPHDLEIATIKRHGSVEAVEVDSLGS